MQGFYRIARLGDAATFQSSDKAIRINRSQELRLLGRQKDSQRTDQTMILLRLHNHGVGLLSRPWREEFLVRHQHDDGHFRAEPLQFSDDQRGLAPVIVKIDHHRTHAFPAKLENSLKPAARAQNIPAVPSQVRTAKIQIYSVVSDTENVVTMPPGHRSPLLAQSLEAARAPACINDS